MTAVIGWCQAEKKTVPTKHNQLSIGSLSTSYQAEQISCQDTITTVFTTEERSPVMAPFPLNQFTWNIWNWTRYKQIKIQCFSWYCVSLSNYLGKLVFKTPWITGNLVCPIVIVSLTLKSANAKQCWETANKLCLCVFPLCVWAGVHVRAHISGHAGVCFCLSATNLRVCVCVQSRHLFVKRPMDQLGIEEERCVSPAAI